MLVGRLILDAEDVVIDMATLPTVEDRQGRYFYKRERATAQEIINKLWKESEQTVNYLGEWHTHPENIPHPSAPDLKNWKRIMRTAQYEQSSLFFVIVGIETIRVWEGKKKTGKFTELAMCEPFFEAS
jgi:integrative and conjugative element protein (TIGR02256 family)